ncbi:MAG: hypothetical protein ACRYFU_19495 [Janthinobacterium lividum]
MNHATAISAVYGAIAHYRRRLACTPKDHSAREIVQMSMLAEYLHDLLMHGTEDQTTEPLAESISGPATFSTAA